MSELTVCQSEAINLATLTLSSLTQTVALAAKTGEALSKVKDSLPHGEYLPWVEANMPISYKQCAKYMKLSKEKPGLLSNISSRRYLDINSELKLLSLDDDMADNIRDVAKDNDLNQKQIAALTKQLADKTREAEEWRQEKFNHRDEARRIAEELKRVKASKKETVYVDDGEKALAQYREETDGKIATLKTLTKEAQDELSTVRREITGSVKAGVDQKLGDQKSEIERMQKHETALASSIELLDREWDALDNSVGVKKDQLTAQKAYKDLLEHMAIKVGILYDNDSDADDIAEWGRLLDSTVVMVDSFRKLLVTPSDTSAVVEQPEFIKDEGEI